jgi:long-chain acyl-CoA synthetase
MDPDRLPEWAETNGHAGKSFSQLSLLPEIRALVQGAVSAVNKGLPSYSTIKKFVILPDDFTVETGELTASFKVKRKAVETKFKAQLDALYAEGGGGGD